MKKFKCYGCCYKNCYVEQIGDVFTPFCCVHGWDDDADWQDVKEEEKELKEEIKETPSWCTMRSIVYHQNEYLTVVGEIGFTKVILSNGKQVSIHELAEARLRLFNEKEMCELVGKAIASKITERIHLVLSSSPNNVIVYGDMMYSNEELLKSFTFTNGQPCGVYEHLENGEWVE